MAMGEDSLIAGMTMDLSLSTTTLQSKHPSLDAVPASQSLDLSLAGPQLLNLSVATTQSRDQALGGPPLSVDLSLALPPSKSAYGSKQCLVCGDRALGFNFSVVSCESCKAFFRRNAHKVPLLLESFLSEFFQKSCLPLYISSIF